MADEVHHEQMLALLMQNVPEAQRQQLEAQAQAIKEAANARAAARQADEEQRRLQAEAEAADRERLREDKRTLQQAKSHSAVRALLHVNEMTRATMLRKLLPSANDALTTIWNSALPGAAKQKLSGVISVVRQIRDGLPAGGNPIGKKRSQRILGSLLLELGLEPLEEIEEVDEVDTPAGKIIPTWMPERDDVDDDANDDTGDFDLPERQQRLPSDYPNTPAIVAQAFETIMGIEKLRVALRFELVPFLKRVYDHIVDSSTGMARTALLNAPGAFMLGGGKCQARKTCVRTLAQAQLRAYRASDVCFVASSLPHRPLKACMFIMGRLLGVSSVLLTTNTSGRDDLFSKFTEFVRSSEASLPSPHEYQPPGTEFRYGLKETSLIPQLVRKPSDEPPTTTLVLRSGSFGKSVAMRDWAAEQMLQGACLVVNNSCQAIFSAVGDIELARGRAHGRGRSFQFLLIIDEADDFLRTKASMDVAGPIDDEAIKMDKAMRRMRESGPLIRFDVSATLFALYLMLVRTGQAQAISMEDIYYIEASHEYVGTDLIIPLEDADGNPVFLDDGELTNKNCFINHKVTSLWDDAMKNGRSLVLDATTSAVTAKANIFEKAIKLLNRHPSAIAVVVSGSEISWWTKVARDGHPDDLRIHQAKGKEKMIGPILHSIDEAFHDRPIFLFGYSQLVRGISYRSKNRVPSHYVLKYGGSMSICRLVQAAGRAHGEQASCLQRNGFGFVRILTLAHDFDTIKNYPGFLESIKDRMGSGMSLQEALETQHPGKFNFSTRNHGQKKLDLDDLKQRLLSFCQAQPGDLPGAEAEAAAVFCKSRKRAVIEVLRDGKGLGPVYDDEDAMRSKEIFEEMCASRDYYSTFLAPGEALPSGATDVTNILKACMAPLTSMGFDAPVDCIKRGKTPLFFLNEHVIDMLPFEDVVGGIPPTLSRQPTPSHTPSHSPALLMPPLSRSGSLEPLSDSQLRDLDDVLEEGTLPASELDQMIRQLEARAPSFEYDYDRMLAQAISNSEIHTSGMSATDQYGAGPSGVNR